MNFMDGTLPDSAMLRFRHVFPTILPSVRKLAPSAFREPLRCRWFVACTTAFGSPFAAVVYRETSEKKAAVVLTSQRASTTAPINLLLKREAFETLVECKLRSNGGYCLLSELLSDPDFQNSAQEVGNNMEMNLLQQITEIKILPLQAQSGHDSANLDLEALPDSDHVVALRSLHESHIPLLRGHRLLQKIKVAIPEEVPAEKTKVVPKKTSFYRRLIGGLSRKAWEGKV